MPEQATGYANLSENTQRIMQSPLGHSTEKRQTNLQSTKSTKVLRLGLTYNVGPTESRLAAGLSLMQADYSPPKDSYSCIQESAVGAWEGREKGTRKRG